MENKKIEITHWPDTFEDFVKEYGTGMSPHMLEDYLIFQAVEHYFPVKECRTCKYYSGYKTRGPCSNNIIENNWDGTVCSHFGCVDWRARE